MIPTYVVPLGRFPEQPRGLLKEFATLPEFSVTVVEAVEREGGDTKLWPAVQLILRDNPHDFFLLCLGDHRFTLSYSREALLNAIMEAEANGADILSGGVSHFEDAVQISDNLFAIQKFTGSPFTIVFRRAYAKLLGVTLSHDSDPDARISDFVENKFVIHPFLSCGASVRRSEEQFGRLREVRSYYAQRPQPEQLLEFNNTVLPVYAINLPERTDRLGHLRREFEGKPEFDLHIVEAVRHRVGGLGLWLSIRRVVEDAMQRNDDFVVVCEDDHTFTEHYSRDYLFQNIIEAYEQGAGMLLGGVANFGHAVPVATHRYWVNFFWCSQFVVLYKTCFRPLLDEPFDEKTTADGSLSQITSNKLVLFPFIRSSMISGIPTPACRDIALLAGQKRCSRQPPPALEESGRLFVPLRPMATITRENIGLLNDKLTVTVAKDDYIPSFEKALKQYSKSANIPGFRKGMVPSGVIRKMHGPAIFKDEVVKSVEKELGRYLGEEKPEIFAQPLPLEEGAPDLDMDRPADYHFEFEIGLKPEVHIDLKSIRATRYVIDITDAMVDEEIERLRNRHGKVVEKEAVDSDDDILNVTFTESMSDGASVTGETQKPKDNSLLVKYFSETFRPGLSGAKVGDTFDVQLITAFDEKEREWLIKDLDLHPDEPGELDKHYSMAITKVGILEKRTLDPDFYKEVFPGQDFAGEAEFRDKLRQDMQTYWNRQTRDYLHHELYHLLLDGTRFDLPDTFLRRWLLVSGDKPKNPSEIDAEFPAFQSQLRWTLVSDKLIRDNQLDVTPDELRAYLRAQVMGYFGASANLEGGNLDWVDAYVERMLKDEQQVETAYRRIVTDKMFHWAEGQITVADKAISLEEFSHMQAEHQHHHHHEH